MPNIASAKKRLRQNVVRQARKRSERSALRTQIKKVRSAITAGDAAVAQSEFVEVCKKLDRAGSRRLIHKNAAARTKSRLAKQISKLGENAS